MNTDNKRIFLAGALIFLVLLLQPFYYDWLGINPIEPQEEVYSDDIQKTESEKEVPKQNPIITSAKKFKTDEEFLIINTSLYSATITNRGGGSVLQMVLNEMNNGDYRFYGSYDNLGEYIDEDLIILSAVENQNCSPCLSSYDASEDDYLLFNAPFSITNNNYSKTYALEDDDELTLSFEYIDESGMVISKDVVFRGDSYEIEHNFNIDNAVNFYGDHFELRWEGGLSPTEKIQLDDITYAFAMSGQSGETEEINQTSADGGFTRQVLDGNTDWVSIRNKYFTSHSINTRYIDFFGFNPIYSSITKYREH